MSNKKIAVITLHAVKNYGSVLQTLATQELFRLMGGQVVVIDYRRKWETGKGYYFYISKKSFKSIIRQLLILPTKIKQKHIFENFLKNYIFLSDRTYQSEDDLIRYSINADIYCTGSDQVWNSGWNGGIIPAYYLTFVPDNKKKISYAASFGNEKVCSVLAEEKKVEEYLKDYAAISIRETGSGKILDNMGIIDYKVVLDPTLQLPKAHWNSIIGTRKVPICNYVLLIQLNRNTKFDAFAVDFASKRNKRLVRLCLRYDQIILPGKSIAIPDVLDYLRYITNADFVLTDSFHAISFCLNFNKDFYCILPKAYSTRLTSILEITNLTGRIITDYTLRERNTFPIDYKRVNQIIESMRRYSMDYLKMALDSER